MILDCFEIFIEKWSDQEAITQTYSSYKLHNTIKFLNGIATQGVIIFISKWWGGKTCDKHITENTGFLKHLYSGYVVLTDRVFDIEDSLSLYGTQLKIQDLTRESPISQRNIFKKQDNSLLLVSMLKGSLDWQDKSTLCCKTWYVALTEKKMKKRVWWHLVKLLMLHVPLYIWLNLLFQKIK